MNITIINGTNRPDNKSQGVSNYLKSYIEANTDLKVTLISTSDFDTSVDGNDSEYKLPEYTQIIEETDGLIVVTPEYNHSFPGSLKALLDKELKAYNHKAVAVAGVSSGMFGGARVVDGIMPILRELGLTVSHTPLYVQQVAKKFSQDGELLDPEFETRVADFVNELIWVSKALKWGRDNL